MTLYDFIMSFLGAIWPLLVVGIIGLILLVADLIKWLFRKDYRVRH